MITSFPQTSSSSSQSSLYHHMSTVSRLFLFFLVFFLFLSSHRSPSPASFQSRLIMPLNLFCPLVVGVKCMHEWMKEGRNEGMQMGERKGKEIRRLSKKEETNEWSVPSFFFFISFVCFSRFLRLRFFQGRSVKAPLKPPWTLLELSAFEEQRITAVFFSVSLSLFY